MAKIGDKIRIIRLADEPYNSNREREEGAIDETENRLLGRKRRVENRDGTLIHQNQGETAGCE